MNPLSATPFERDPYAARDDRTDEEIAAIRALAAALDALLDAPVSRADPAARAAAEADERLPTTETAPIVRVARTDDEEPPPSVGLQNGLADRMRGVLRGVLDRAKKNRTPR